MLLKFEVMKVVWENETLFLEYIRKHVVNEVEIIQTNICLPIHAVFLPVKL